MPVTVEGICTIAELKLSVVAGHEGVSRDVRWVHISEVADPTPWLRGGELLLTTGLQVGADDDFEAYVHRLADAGLAGIGFGVGMGHAEVPAPMIAAANERGIPVLLVPVDTAYMAISEAVSQLLAADRYDAIGRAFAAQQQLTRAALKSEKELVEEIALQLGGWVIQTDAVGEVVQAWPPESLERLPALLPDLVRARESGGKGSASIITPGASTVIQPMSVDGLPRGFLIAGVDHPIEAFERLVLTASIALLTLEAERSRAVSARLHRLRSSILTQALRDHDPSRDAVRQMASWGLDSAAIRVLVVLAPVRDQRDILDGVITVLADLDIPGAATTHQSRGGAHLVVLLPDDAQAVASVAGVVEGIDGAFVGVGELSSLEEFQRSYRGALHAASIGRTERHPVTEFEDLAAMQLLLSTNSPESLEYFVERVLGPLQAEMVKGKDVDLRRTLEAFLASNGHWNEAATSLQVHRHTLRSRMEKVAALTNRDVDSAYARMELWLALLIEGSMGQYRDED